MKTSALRIAVVGGGIGGLTTALALKERGFAIQVFEQASHPGEVGAGIQLAPNSVRLLQRLGLGERLREVSVIPSSMQIRRWQDGKTIANLSMGERVETTYGFPSYAIHRGDLHKILREAFPVEDIMTGKKCTGVQQDGRNVALSFADGSIETADLVIGADGIHSVIRHSISSDSVHFSYTNAYRALVPMERVPFLRQEEPAFISWVGPQQHFFCYPVSCGRLLNIGAVVPSPDWQIESWSSQGRVEDVAHAFADWHEDVKSIIRAMDTTMRWALYDRDPLLSWSQGHVTLLGDAAHAMLPHQSQGAGQAVEDAVALAILLQDATIDTLSERLLRYEAFRKPRTTKVQQISRENGKALHVVDGDQQHQRDADFQMTIQQRNEWLWKYDVEKELSVQKMA